MCQARGSVGTEPASRSCGVSYGRSSMLFRVQKVNVLGLWSHGLAARGVSVLSLERSEELVRAVHWHQCERKRKRTKTHARCLIRTSALSWTEDQFTEAKILYSHLYSYLCNVMFAMNSLRAGSPLATEFCGRVPQWPIESLPTGWRMERAQNLATRPFHLRAFEWWRGLGMECSIKHLPQ